jgi:hypothetical protein
MIFASENQEIGGAMSISPKFAPTNGSDYSMGSDFHFQHIVLGKTLCKRLDLNFPQPQKRKPTSEAAFSACSNVPEDRAWL